MKKVTIEIDEDLYKIIGMLYGYTSVEETDKETVEYDITEQLIQGLEELREVGELEEDAAIALDKYLSDYSAENETNSDNDD